MKKIIKILSRVAIVLGIIFILLIGVAILDMKKEFEDSVGIVKEEQQIRESYSSGGGVWGGGGGSW